MHLAPRTRDAGLNANNDVIEVRNDLRKVADVSEEHVEVARLASALLTPRVAESHNQRAAVLARLLEIAADVGLHRVRERDVRPAHAVRGHAVLALDAPARKAAQLPERRVVCLRALPLREALRLECRPAARSISARRTVESVCAVHILNVRLEVVFWIRRSVSLGLATELRRANRCRNCGERRRSLDVRGVHVHFSFQIIVPSAQAS